MPAPLRRPSTSSAQAVAAVTALGSEATTTWVGIDGPGGAGKTTLAAAIERADARVTVVHVDDFAGPGVDEWDWERLRQQLLRPLLDGRVARYQIWDWHRDQGGAWVDVHPGGIVVVEGVSSTRREVGAPWALTIWVDTPPAERQARAIARDGAAVWQNQWVGHWLVTEQAYIARERPLERVDLVVRGDDPSAPAGP